MSEELTEDQVKIAKLAAEIALAQMQTHFYESVGKAVMKKVLQFIGMTSIAIAVWLYDKGFIKIG